MREENEKFDNFNHEGADHSRSDQKDISIQPQQDSCFVNEDTNPDSSSAPAEHYPQEQPYMQQQYSQQPWDSQYVYVPPAPQQPARKKKTVLPHTPFQKKMFMLVRICIILIAAIFAYCIISDAVFYETVNVPASSTGVVKCADNTSSESHVNFESTPIYQGDEEISPDENGRYTASEVAAIVSPSIVEITSFDAAGIETGSGSGIILTEDGYILTNAHVVADSSRFGITFNDGSKIEGTLIGYDSKSDLAVLKVKADGLIPAALGDSDSLVVGEEVVAIGSPAGLTSTVTKGIVSALDRQIRSTSTGFYMECIQTDAAISPGNSGGALVNMYGQVVGVTSSKYASYYSGTYEGLGFAISINQAAPIFEEIIENGYVSGRVRIGITFISMEDEAIQNEFMLYYNLDKAPTKGIWIAEIAEDCDIANSELRIDDLILSVNGTEVNNYDDLSAVIFDCKAGDVLTAECRRYSKDGSYKDFTIKFALMEDTSGDY